MKPFYFALALASFAMPLAVRPVEAQQVVPVRPAKTILVFINGQVRKPNAYEMPANATLGSLLALAGGETNDAALSKVTVQRRGGTTQTINLHEILGKTRADFALQEGDSVIVPRNENRILVMGEVLHPGVYAIPEGRTLSVAEALTLAGGITKNGKAEVTLFPQGAMLISRQETPKTGKLMPPKPIHGVKLDQLLQSGDMLHIRRAEPKNSPDARFPKLWLLSPNAAS